MQIRTRKNIIALIRTTYDPLTKRGRSQQLGTLAKDAATAPDELLAQLTEPERRQLNSWLAYQQTVRAVENQRSTGLNLPLLLQEAAAWYRRQPKDRNLPALAAASRDAWSALLAAMSTAGVGRTRTRTTSKK